MVGSGSEPAGPICTALAQAVSEKAKIKVKKRIETPVSAERMANVGKTYGKLYGSMPPGTRDATAGGEKTQPKTARVTQTPPAAETPVSTVPQAQSVKTMRGCQASSVA